LLTEGLEVIERNTKVQVQLIEDLLDMSRIISGKVRLDVKRIDPAAFIASAFETVAPSAKAKGIHLHKVLDSDAGPIAGDANRLQQVVWNLLSNAIKFTPKGGKVQVLMERVNSHIEITVNDTGQGIDPQFLPHIFERFRQADASSTRSHGGLGLGLAIAKQLVELHGGSISAESPGIGKGATFSVVLPLLVVNLMSSPEPKSKPRAIQARPFECSPTVLAGVTVLVVDDESDARGLVKRVLEECGAEVVVAGSAAEALEMVPTVKPNVLVSDIGMPGVDGYELLRRIRALGETKGGDVPAIALTAFARSEDRTRALLAGYLVHVSKPVEPHELIATVATVGGRTG
jgi:CheY-like chemotaxis protein